MHLAIPALFSLFAAMAQASIQIPANQTDGCVHRQRYRCIETHIRIGDVNTTASGTRIAKTASIRQKRDFDFPPHSHIECDTTNVFYHDDFYSKGAYDGFVTACKASKGRKLEGGKAIYVRYSSSSAYFCSYRRILVLWTSGRKLLLVFRGNALTPPTIGRSLVCGPLGSLPLLRIWSPFDGV